MRTIGPYMDIGWTFVIAVGGGAWIGYKADTHFGTKPWFLLLGAVLGMVVGFYRFLSVVLRK
jgi:F0F1-type ATP synthase assembly protein I